MVTYEAVPVSPSVDEKTIFLGNEDAVQAYQQRIVQRPTVGQRIVAKLVRLSVGLLAVLGLLQLISFTPLRHFTPDLFNGLSRHAHHKHGRYGHHKHPHSHGWPPHMPGREGHPPPFFHPKPIECFDLSDSKAAVNFSITLPHPGAPLHLSPSLGNADVQLYTDEADKEADVEELPHLPSPPHGPPGGPPGRGPPRPPRPPRLPHGKPQTIVVGIERVAAHKAHRSYLTSHDFSAEKDEGDDDEKKKKQQLFVCSLELPLRQVGLGLFNEKPGKTPPPPPPPPAHEQKKDNEDKPKPPPKKHDPFPPVALAIRHPAGEPFTVTSALPFFHPLPPPHHRPHGPHGPHDGPPHPPPPPPPHGHPHPPPPPPSSSERSEEARSKGMVIVITTFANKMCGAGRRLMSTIGRS